ncbi:uncharacterized protein LOC129615211 [Condylostylus longicornis]|uniref:uncharacterized protein LOC129615211 n=1 Tax=Condylostylus longicornis TaxID=2530218 RepID=UPI00244DE64A|nr:uncharacterized protein LOC129615211 [Condylostylus longicornis]
MANLKDELDEYLLLNSEQKKTFKIGLKIPSIRGTDVGKLFRNNEPEANSWLEETQNSCCPKLTRVQRILCFIACLCLGTFFMGMSIFYIPVLILKARKFALLYTLGSLFFILSFGFLLGFMSFFSSMLSKQRLGISVTYAGSLIATLYFAIIVHSTALTVVFAVTQVISLLFLVINEIPGRATGLKFFGKLIKTGVSETLPV